MYRHNAYNIGTGEIISATSGNHLKRLVQEANRYNKRHCPGVSCTWYFCHDYGAKWIANGLPLQ